jgi:regulator of sigma E protease
MILLDIVRNVVAILLVFSITIFIHELGHFVFMKLFKVRVETFAIGFGKRLFGVKWGDTDFCLCAFPFGGYVKPVGMHSKEYEAMIEGETAAQTESSGSSSSGGTADGTQTNPETSHAPSPSLAEGVADEMEAMRSKAWWQKVLILSAGCGFNLLGAAFALFLLNFGGYHRSAPLEPIVEGLRGLEHLAPVQKLDRIIAVNQTPVANTSEVLEALHSAGAVRNPTTVSLTVERAGEKLELEITPYPDPLWPRHMEDVAKVGEIEISSPREIPRALRRTIHEMTDQTTVPVTVRLAGGRTEERILHQASLTGALWFASVLEFRQPAFVMGTLPNLPAERAGFRKGDTILSVAGVDVKSSAEARAEIISRRNQPTEVVVQRTDPRTNEVQKVPLTVTVQTNPLQPEQGRIGIVFGLPQTEFYSLSLFPAIQESFAGMWRAVTTNWHALGLVFGSGNLAFIGENLGGPIAIGVMTAKAANQGWIDLIMLFVAFNTMLAIINIMPIPVLDGGHIVFATVEAILGRPIPLAVFVWVHNVFIILILTLAITLTFNDVIRNAWRVLGIFG